MASIARSSSYSGAFSTDAVVEVARRLRGEAGRASQLGLVFASPDYLPVLDEFCDILRVEGWMVDVVGCTGAGWIGGGEEQENSPGFSVLALSNPETRFFIREIGDEEDVAAGSPVRLAFLDPQNLQPEPWLEAFNREHPEGVLIGGLASGANIQNPQEGGVFHNGRLVERGVMVGWSGGGLRIQGVVSQGCRPIGEPLTVTRAENNVVYALGAQPAYQALESAFQTLTDQEKSTARGNLLAGLATSEYVEEFQAGDFLVRSIIGADPNSGAVVIGGIPRIGQTLQYQYRDRQAARMDLTGQLRWASEEFPRMVGVLLCSCVGRGQTFFGSPNHDVSCVTEVFGDLPAGGFLGQGEIGPLHGVNCLTTYSAVVGLFYDDEESI